MLRFITETFERLIGELSCSQTRDMIFEMGGKNKTRQQIRNVPLPAYLVKDDIIHPFKQEIPLYQCGLLY